MLTLANTGIGCEVAYQWTWNLCIESLSFFRFPVFSLLFCLSQWAPHMFLTWGVKIHVLNTLVINFKLPVMHRCHIKEQYKSTSLKGSFNQRENTALSSLHPDPHDFNPSSVF